MLITKFNAMIRNRFIWGCIAFLVVMAFVVWGTQTGGHRDSARVGRAGVLNGNPVGMEEFRRAYFNSYLSMCLSYGRRLNINEEIDGLINSEAWKRLAVLREARKMSLSVTNDEVDAAIREQPFLVVDGQFSPVYYHGFIMGFLAELGATEPQFEEFMREEILLKKSRYLLAQSAWVPSADRLQVFHRLYDEFVMKYVALMHDELGHMADVTEEDGRLFFSQNSEKFIIPEKMRVKVTSFPFIDFIDASAIDDELMQKHYDEYITELIEKDEDEWATIPLLEDVEDEVRVKAAIKQARENALDQAYSFELMLVPGRSGQAVSFEQAAIAMGRPVLTSDFFSVDAKLDNLNVGLDFNKTAFNLYPTPDAYFSYPVEGEEVFYVMGYHERKEARIPEFEEVSESVMESARERAITELLEELADQVRDAMEYDLSHDISFSDSAASFGLEVFMTNPFSVTSMSDEYDNTEKSYKLMHHAISRNEGELTDVISLNDGLLIGYVKSRKTADAAMYNAISEELGEYVKQRRRQIIFESWQESLLSPDRFENFLIESKNVQDGLDD